MPFLTDARRQMFAGREVDETPADLRSFLACYTGEAGLMLGAHAKGQLIASIGFRAYDGRFPRLNAHLPQTGVVEVVRLFVLPAWRRQGVAHALVQALSEEAQARQVQALYLHTQGFLSGAEAFWLEQGFTLLEQETDPEWQTIHFWRDPAQ